MAASAAWAVSADTPKTSIKFCNGADSCMSLDAARAVSGAKGWGCEDQQQ
ncbi:MAG: hypothetical protein HQ512_13675 [Rhodospirillales bacterium]|nr:hypothetical protein [Rhodospirillales bacterium]